jgi:hypothetical protein
MGAGSAQGFLIAPPRPEDQFDFFVRNSRWGRPAPVTADAATLAARPA